MKRLLALLAICLPICLFGQGFGSFLSDPPYLAKDRAGASIPTSSIYAWYDAGQFLTNDSGVYPPANNDRLGTWGIAMGATFSYLIGSRGSGALPDPLFLSAGNFTNGPAIRNAGFNASYRQMTRGEPAWSGGANIPQPFTVFLVFKKIADNPNGVDTLMGSEADKTLLYLKAKTDGSITMYAGTALAGSASAVALNTWYLLTAQFNGASSFMRTNGVLYASGNIGSNPIVGMSLGMTDNFDFLIGDYSNLVFYNRALTADEILVVETALATRH